MDVELHEPEVLDGFGSLISQYRPDFIIEVLNNDIGFKIEPHFLNLNYLFYEINEVKMTIQLEEHLVRKNQTQSNSFNFLICQLETAKYLNLELPKSIS